MLGSNRLGLSLVWINHCYQIDTWHICQDASMMLAEASHANDSHP